MDVSAKDVANMRSVWVVRGKRPGGIAVNNESVMELKKLQRSAESSMSNCSSRGLRLRFIDERQQIFHVAFWRIKNFAWLRVMRIFCSPQALITSSTYLGLRPGNERSMSRRTDVNCARDVRRAMFSESRIFDDQVETVRAAGPVNVRQCWMMSRRENWPLVNPVSAAPGDRAPMASAAHWDGARTVFRGRVREAGGRLWMSVNSGVMDGLSIVVFIFLFYLFDGVAAGAADKFGTVDVCAAGGAVEGFEVRAGNP